MFNACWNNAIDLKKKKKKKKKKNFDTNRKNTPISQLECFFFFFFFFFVCLFFGFFYNTFIDLTANAFRFKKELIHFNPFNSEFLKWTLPL